MSIEKDVNTAHREIWRKRHALDKERRNKLEELMREFDKEHRQKLKALMDECEQIGHNFKFTNLGPLGDPWFTCTVCGKTKVEIDR